MKEICLGTVQFGLNYGINNKTGKPDKEEVFDILNYSLEMGITILDTAAAYGNAEELIGEYIRTHKKESSLKVITKLRPNLFEEPRLDSEEIKRTIKREVTESLKKLNIKTLHGLLLHTPSDYYIEDVLEALGEIKTEGLSENIGVSIYDKQTALDVVSNSLMDFIQVPYNVFDQRLDEEEFFSLAHKNKIKIFTRSIFLQGLLLIETLDLPKHLQEAKSYLLQYRNICAKYSITTQEAAIQFIKESPQHNNIVLGIDNMKQLAEDVELFQKDALNTDLIKELKETFNNKVAKAIIVPSLWAKKEK